MAQPYRLAPGLAAVVRIVELGAAPLLVLALLVGAVELHKASKQESGATLDVILASVGVVLAVIGLSFFLIHGFNQGHSSTSSRNQCINNLRRLDLTIEEIAQEQHLGRGAVVDKAAIQQRVSRKNLRCPDGGTYSYGIVGE